MNRRRWMLWAALIAVGCNGQLSMNGGDGGAAAITSAGGAGGAGGKAQSGGAGAGGAGAGHKAQSGGAGEAGEADVDSLGGASGATAGADFGAANTAGYPAAGAPSGATGGMAPDQGEIGQDCVPGGLVTDAEDGPAKAMIRTLDRCHDGLACNAQGKCAPAPDCPSSGLCVLRRATLSGSGSGGGGGTAGFSPDTGTAGVATFPAGGSGGNGPLFYATAKKGVVGLAANETHLYWIEYGTRDALGNHQHDGALLSYSTTDGTTLILAAALAGPIGLELTSSHAYVYIDGAPPIGAPTQPQLLRVPLAGGSAQLVQDGAQPYSFAAAGSRAFWTSYGNNVYSLLSDTNATPTVFLADSVYSLTCDATDIYYSLSFGNGLMHTPIANAAPTAIGVSAYGFVLHEDGIFTLESVGTGGLLSRAPKSGGRFRRVRALGNGMPNGLRVVADRYFLNVVQGPILGSNGAFFHKTQVLTAGFVGSDPPIRLLERSEPQTWVDQLWVGTAHALYWSDGPAIYQQPLPAP